MTVRSRVLSSILFAVVSGIVYGSILRVTGETTSSAVRSTLVFVPTVGVVWFLWWTFKTRRTGRKDREA